MLGIYTAPPSQGGTLLLDATPFAEGVTCSTNDHGFEALPARIPHPLAEAFGLYTSSTLYAAVVRDGSIVWEGRLEDPAVYAGQSGSGLTMQALGAWRSLTDDRYTALWSTTSVADWRVLTDDDFAAATVLPQRFEMDNNNRIYISPRKNENFGNAPNVFGFWGYLIPDQSTRQIVGFSCDIAFDAPVNWRLTIDSRDSAWAVATNLVTINGTGALQATTLQVTFTAAPRLTVRLFFNAANAALAAETGAIYAKLTNLRISTSATRVNTTFTNNEVAGANVLIQVPTTAGMYVGQRLRLAERVIPGGESVIVKTIPNTTEFTADLANNHTAGQTIRGFTLYADEIVKDIVAQVSTLNSTQLSSSTALIQSPGLDLTDEVYEDAVPTDILTHLAELGDSQTTPRQWEVGVWENRMLHFRPRGSVAKAWYVDVTNLGIARTLEDLSNSVYATYKDAAGRTLRTANSTDSTSIARYGLTRRSNISADTTSSTQAGVQRDAQLADHKDPLPRATVGFNAIYDAGGARWPLWMVRSGDTVTIRNLPPSISTAIDRIRTFRISHTLYNLTTRALEIELEVPPPRLATLLARRAEGIKR